jgi:hypothetical protein
MGDPTDAELWESLHRDIALADYRMAEARRFLDQAKEAAAELLRRAQQQG